MYETHTIPTGHIECPNCDGIGCDISHDGDSWGDRGEYKPVFTYKTCEVCEGTGHITPERNQQYREYHGLDAED